LAVPPEEIQLVVQGFPATYLQRLLTFMSTDLEGSPHLEFYLLWCLHVFNFHGRYLKDQSSLFMSTFRNLQKSITNRHNVLSKLCDDNTYTLDYLCTMGDLEQIAKPEELLLDSLPFSEEDVVITKRKKKRGAAETNGMDE